MPDVPTIHYSEKLVGHEQVQQSIPEEERIDQNWENFKKNIHEATDELQNHHANVGLRIAKINYFIPVYSSPETYRMQLNFKLAHIV